MNKEYKYINKAPIGCNDCEGCSECCHDMDNSIIQDPYDLWNFCSHMKVSGGEEVTFDLLISEDGPWELSEHGHMLLPNIKMVDDGVCPFLNEHGRCSIHKIRSGLCRLYPLGRQYTTTESYSEKLTYYILDESLGCKKITGGGTPVIISDWIGIPNPDKYEAFLLAWHAVKNDMLILSNVMDEDNYSRLQSLLLRLFYESNYKSDFYSDFNDRTKIWEGIRDAAFNRA